MIRFIAILVALGCIYSTDAAVFTPQMIDWEAAGTGKTVDAVVESVATPGASPNVFTGVADSLDGLAGNALYQTGLFGSGGVAANGIFSGIIGGDNYTFQVSDYGNGSGRVKNALLLDNTGNQSFFLSTPGEFAQIALMGFAAGTDAALSGEIIFSDATTQAFSGLTLSDWFSGTSTNSIYQFNDRVNIANGAEDVRINGNFYAITLTVSSTGKAVAGVTLSNSASNSNGFIVAAAGSPVPEPATYIVFTIFGCMLLFLRKRNI